MPGRSRYLEAQILRDLQRKMVFLAGARQVGKTTLARSLPQADDGYLNWDVPADRDRILRREMPVSPLWVLDEIHKYRSWRNLCHWRNERVDKNLRYFVARARPEEAWQVSAMGEKDFRTPEGIRVAPAITLLSRLV